jgi:hypothetical protein
MADISDVAKKAIPANDIKHGTVVTHCLPGGEFIVDNTHVKRETTTLPIEQRYDTRNDDPRYYSGDTAN